MILFKEVFERAIHLFDDPDIQKAYVQNKVVFEKMMRPYLINGVLKFNTPSKISAKLQYRDEPQGQIEIINGNGEKTYGVSVRPVENSSIVLLIGGKPDYYGLFDYESNQAHFSRPLSSEETGAVEWYYAGAFTEDFNKVFGSEYGATLTDGVTTILAYCLLLSWAERNKNFIIEIRNLLTDSDFKIYSPANSIMSKIDWHRNLESGLASEQSKLAWNIRIANIGGRSLG